MKTSKEIETTNPTEYMADLVNVATVEFNIAKKQRLEEMGFDPEKHMLQVERFEDKERITIFPRLNFPSKEFYFPEFKLKDA